MTKSYSPSRVSNMSEGKLKRKRLYTKRVRAAAIARAAKVELKERPRRLRREREIRKQEALAAMEAAAGYTTQTIREITQAATRRPGPQERLAIYKRRYAALRSRRADLLDAEIVETTEPTPLIKSESNAAKNAFLEDLFTTLREADAIARANAAGSTREVNDTEHQRTVSSSWIQKIWYNNVDRVIHTHLGPPGHTKHYAWDCPPQVYAVWVAARELCRTDDVRGARVQTAPVAGTRQARARTQMMRWWVGKTPSLGATYWYYAKNLLGSRRPDLENEPAPY